MCCLLTPRVFSKTGEVPPIEAFADFVALENSGLLRLSAFVLISTPEAVINEQGVEVKVSIINRILQIFEVSPKRYSLVSTGFSAAGWRLHRCR